jgi:carbonic anhydrase
VYRLHRRELDAIRDPEKRHRRLVELNVIEQCINLFKTGAVQRMRVETYKQGFEYTIPRIHACVFDPATGELNRLEVCSSHDSFYFSSFVSLFIFTNVLPIIPWRL